MQGTPDGNAAPGSGKHKALFERPIEGLAGAITALKGACDRLRDSMDGVNTDLEDANQRLGEALKVHSETAIYLGDVLAGLPTGVVVVDRNGRVVLFNRAAEAITGFICSEVIGRSYAETLGKGIPQRQTPLYTLATGSPLGQEEKWLEAKSGDRVPVSSSTSLIGSGDPMTGAIEVIVDLRKLKALEEEIDRVRTLAAVGELAAVVAHEIRNPLGGVKGFVSLLERDFDSNPDALELVRRIREGIGSIENIVDDLLEAGRSNKLTFGHTEMCNEISKVVQLSEMAVRGEGRRVEFEVLTPHAPVYCRVDAARVRQALTNLIRNAAEAAGDNGRVAVRLRAGSGPEDRTPPATTGPRDHLAIEVTDSGTGIPAGVVDRIFTPFFTTKHGGTGLGLHTVRRIAGLHGGDVTYSPGESGGSTFTMTIPRW